MSEMVPSQRWTWNETSNTLELMSSAPDRQDKKKKDKRDINAQRAAQNRGGGRRSPMRQVIKQTADHTTVTLQDVKDVARAMMFEVEDISDAFDGIYNTPQFDEFLFYLLNYFHCFFEKREKETVVNPVHIEPSLAEKQLYAELCAKLIIAQKQLGRTYGVLILGLGQCQYHHTSCGMSLHSNSELDRSKYESMYSFCTFFVWIAFRRKNHDAIKLEINRMLRTDHFNPVSLARKPARAAMDGDEETDRTNNKSSAGEKHLRQINRVSLKTIMNLRSAAVVSMLPYPKEESSWLFQRQYLNDVEFIEQHRSMSVEEQLIQDFKHLEVDHPHLHLGIIGESLTLFDPITLACVEEESAEKNKEKRLSKAAAESQPAT